MEASGAVDKTVVGAGVLMTSHVTSTVPLNVPRGLHQSWGTRNEPESIAISECSCRELCQQPTRVADRLVYPKVRAKLQGGAKPLGDQTRISPSLRAAPRQRVSAKNRHQIPATIVHSVLGVGILVDAESGHEIPPFWAGLLRTTTGVMADGACLVDWRGSFA